MESGEHLARTLINERPALRERFELVRVIGQGAGGIVQLVRDLRHGGRHVALKILTSQNAFDEHTLERFKREMNICISLRHPNLVEAYEFVQLENTIAYTMEFVEGSDLGKLFSKRRFTIREIGDYVLQLLAGLDQLHRNDLVHRDVKLENLLVRSDGRLKLSDLGLVKHLAQDKMTRTGILLGTAQYLPPEYVRGSGFDARGDVYAAGLILLELMSGKRWLHELSGNAVLEHLLKTRFKIPPHFLEGMPASMVAVIRGATHPDHLARYQSAAQMANALKAALAAIEREQRGNLELPAVPPRRGWRTRAGVGAGAIMLGAVVALAALPAALPTGAKIPPGHFEGVLRDPESGTNTYFALEVGGARMRVYTGLSGCASADVDGTGELSCARTGLVLKLLDSASGRAFGVLEDRAEKRRYAFDVALPGANR